MPADVSTDVPNMGTRSGVGIVLGEAARVVTLTPRAVISRPETGARRPRGAWLPARPRRASG